MAGHIKYEPVLKCFEGKAFNKYSQFGEDGLIKAAFDLIGMTNRWCFEVGAADGRFFSNTLALRETGWSSVLAESDLEKYQELSREFGHLADCFHLEVDSIDCWLSETDCPEYVDFGSIDVDGQDYWLWYDMEDYRPRVLLIEFSPYVGTKWTPHYDFICERGAGYRMQTAEGPMVELGESRGYELVAKTYCNLLFIDKGALL